MTSSDDGAHSDQTENHQFQAEVAKLLHLMVHSVYSEREVFLRELISNASDACDKLRYAALTSPELAGSDAVFRIVVRADKEASVLEIADNGIGMDRSELIENLGTIARSGTSQFVESLSGDAAKDTQLIGQFGVGFYSAFMVASRVDVFSRKAGSEDIWCWSSNGEGAFEISEAKEEVNLLDGRGTLIRLHLSEESKEFLEPSTLKRIIKDYSDHISFPIFFAEDSDGDGEQVNSSGALWGRPKSEVSEDQYKEFYHHVGGQFDDPALTIHYRAEGRHEYSVLLFIPSQRPLDLFDPNRNARVRLYVKRVFITDDAELMPGYLRFIRGVIDSEDMPLNISREMLQNNPLVANIRGAVKRRVLTELKKAAEKDKETFLSIWKAFGAVIKEGLYEDFEQRDALLELSLFRTTSSGDGYRSLNDYVEDMSENQSEIYFIQGDDPDALANSPQLEGYKARGLEVLLLSDPVDAFWTSSVPQFNEKSFTSVSRGEADLDKFPTESGSTSEDEPSDASLGTLVAAFKQVLEGRVADVRKSNRLTTSPVCLVTDGAAMDPYMERIMAQSRGEDGAALDLMSTRILEINGSHPLVRVLADKAASDGVSKDIEDAARLLLDQARIIEGEAVVDPAEFTQKMSAFVERALAS